MKNKSALKNKAPAELTLRCILLSIVLTIILAASNAYLALRLGILASASIPAAIVSMGVLRFFKQATILENNAVQTAASAGEAVAGGIVYTIPALIILNYWHQFSYLDNFLIAFCGGVLGVLFSIPLRRVLVHDESLQFPEGRAIAQVLKSSDEKIGFSDIVYGSVIGSVIELLQGGFKLLAGSWQYWFSAKRTLFCVGMGFSATMLGAGYLIGFDMAFSIFLGALVAWGGALPVASYKFPSYLLHHSAEQAGSLIWANELRYLGIGAMLFAGVWTFAQLLRPLLRSMQYSIRQFSEKMSEKRPERVDHDIPLSIIALAVGAMMVILFLFFKHIFPCEQIGFQSVASYGVVLVAVLYVLIIGFLFSVITAYFSGMVGVTASPGSSVVIAGILFAAWLLLSAITAYLPLPLSALQIKAAEAIVIIIASIVTGIAAIANDNTQDLKVGQLVGATPWKQQLMLLLGVLVASCVIPPVMQLLFDVYGIAGVMPRPGMDVSQSLPAPTAALLAAITKAVFRHDLPWGMMGVGALLILIVIALNHLLQRRLNVRLSILGVAIGMYLPMSTSFPLFLGGLIAWTVNKSLAKQRLSLKALGLHKQIGTRVACGMLAGAALMDVLLAVPFSILHSPDAWRLFSDTWEASVGVVLSMLMVVGFGFWMVTHAKKIDTPVIRRPNTTA